MKDDSLFLSVTEVAHRMGVDPHVLRCRLRADPKAAGFPISIIGRRILIPREAFEKFCSGK